MHQLAESQRVEVTSQTSRAPNLGYSRTIFEGVLSVECTYHRPANFILDYSVEFLLLSLLLDFPHPLTRLYLFPDETEVSRKSMVRRRNNEGIWIRAPSWYRSVSPFPCRLSRKFQACLFLLKGCYTSLTKQIPYTSKCDSNLLIYILKLKYFSLTFSFVYLAFVTTGYKPIAHTNHKSIKCAQKKSK